MPNNKLADIDFTLEWKSPSAEHTDIFHLQNVDLSNDILPLGFADKIAALKIDESCSQTFPAKDILDENEGYSTHKVLPFKADLFDNNFKDQHSPPLLYRFYPSAIAWQGLETDPTDYTPFRLNSIDGDNIIADRNHPLAKYYLTLSAKKTKESDLTKDNKRNKKHIGKIITSRGPGMQAPFDYGDPIFFKQYPFEKPKQKELSKPTLDSIAIAQIEHLYSQLLPNYSKVLDLMSGQNSYLSEDYPPGLLSGIGSNEELLSANKRLDTYQIQDLNTDAILPFEADSFDDAICTLSIETLADPLQVMKEVARVVNTGGKFIITFSNKGYPSQAISLWGQLHPFERMQLVLEYFRESGLFEELNTFSKRGALSPFNEDNLSRKKMSESVFAVWGIVK